MTVIRFEVAAKPVSTNEGYEPCVRGGRHTFKLTTPAQVYKGLLTQAARRAHRMAGSPPALTEDVVVGVRFTFPTLGNDIDGPAKFVLDAIANGTPSHPGARIVLNDTRIRRVILEKADADRACPRTLVAVASDDAPGCPHCGCVCGDLLP